jgi:hypothetical protein
VKVKRLDLSLTKFSWTRLIDMFKLDFLSVTAFLSSIFVFLGFCELLYMCSSLKQKYLLSLNTQYNKGVIDGK